MRNREHADEVFMARALELAARAWGETHPNPMVGALIVEDGVIVAEGWHRASGQAHAEVEALRALGRAPAADATLYVTLEPCSTAGRTGACTDAIQRAGIQRVVVGAVDPNPDHAGRGLDVLRAAGVEVVSGVLESACDDLNLIFNHWIATRRPLLAAKVATTLDGKFAAANGQSKWVTGAAARADVMRWRRYFPAIAVTAQTVLADNPSLTSRTDTGVWCPRRFVFDRQLKTVERFGALNLFSDDFADRTVLCCAEGRDVQRVADAGVECWQLPERDGHLDLDAFVARCAVESITGVYIESGPRLLSSLLEQGCADYLFHYLAPRYLSDACAVGVGTERNTCSMDQTYDLVGMQSALIGSDLLVRGRVRRD